ncbi:MAG: DUF3656 domain-containing protein, partial [Eubacteriales bacterium]|nr:DUF3656 domain-containing protein [Eubacteriales bacterium]
RSVLCESGVASLKIEGRLKSPEYVAIVAGIYRKALDAIAAGSFDPDDPKPMAELLQIFNRGGFTRGHLMDAQDAALCASNRVSHEGLPLGEVLAVSGSLAKVRLSRPLNDGDSLQLRGDRDDDLRYSGHDAPAGQTATLRLRPELRVKAGCPVAKLTDAQQLLRARTHQPKSIPITMNAAFRVGMPMSLTLSDGTTTVSVKGEIPQAALSRAAVVTDVQRQLSKLGDTPFSLSDSEALTILLDDDLFLPVGVLNALRREAVERLIEARIQAFHKQPRQISRHANDASSASTAPSAVIAPSTLAVAFYEPEQAEALLNSGATLLIYRPTDYRPQALDAALSRLPNGTWLKLPPQISEAAFEDVKAVLLSHRDRLGGLVAGSYGQLLLQVGLPILAGEELPVTNPNALQALPHACGFCLWPEWTFTEQKPLFPSPMPTLLKVYGRETLMLLNHCPLRAARGLVAHRESCTLCQSPYETCGQADPLLTDQKGYAFPLRRTAFPEGCVISVLNALPTDLRSFEQDRRLLGAGMLLSFTTETPEEQRQITQAFSALLSDASIPKAFGATAGHWQRGVE